ncbi:hypothetical protein E3E22_07100 [Thermococcus sp. MV5]|uniref:hypothetical protein n=1 Tax=Thermococcus sp. MV5 TaxID=1638272 RepID=UPI00143C6071|nr:hypothetical protein [Thermococcus sp. MV5]NJE26387.1 hypothetical protein [Thermococcus sp. MV5]
MEKLMIFTLFLIFSGGVIAATYVNTRKVIIKPLIFSVMASAIGAISLFKLGSPFMKYGTAAIFLSTILWTYKDLIFGKSNLMNRIWLLTSILNFVLFVAILIRSIMGANG